MIDGQNFENVFDRPVSFGQGDGHTTCCSLDYPYFKEHYKMRAIDLSRQETLMLIRKQYRKLILPEMPHLNKLKLGRKYCTEVTLYLSSNVVADSNDENNFPLKLLFTNPQVLKIAKLLQMIHHLT